MELLKIAINLDITDQTGKGNKDIVRIYGKDAFDILDNTLIVKIPLNPLASTTNVGQDVGQDLQDVILKCISSNSKITKKEIADIAGVSEKTIEREMKKMTNVKFKGHGFRGHWEIMKD